MIRDPQETRQVRSAARRACAQVTLLLPVGAGDCRSSGSSKEAYLILTIATARTSSAKSTVDMCAHTRRSRRPMLSRRSSSGSASELRDMPEDPANLIRAAAVETALSSTRGDEHDYNALRTPDSVLRTKIR